MYQILPGKSFPLGATVDAGGVNFAVFSAHADNIELCVFNETGTEELQRLSLPHFEDDVWSGYVPGLKAGARYGLRAYGPYAPHEGQRFNPYKLLLDPYARELDGPLNYHPCQLAYDASQIDDLKMDTRDSADYMPKCVVTDALPSIETQRPLIPLAETIIFELHVKGFSKTDCKIPAPLRGTYKALCEPATIKYLKELGVSSIELLPIHASCAEPFLYERGRPNYWGYNNYHFFVLESRYAKDHALQEMREVVHAMHKARIEVIIDVVYNHTAEGSHLGPTYSFKGLDNRSYYQLMEQDRRFYANHSGCGNALNLSHPRVMQMVMDSLRYLVEQVGVDGFRFDLASTLGRGAQHYFSNQNHFFTALAQDPVLAGVKLIAEPWDIGYNGYQLGNFPNRWVEWNDKFRDTARRFWRGDHAMAPEFAKRLHGSADVFERHGRSPHASLNFITAHDGFSLRDLVSYEERHNYANGEDNRDGHGSNFSANYGIEGPTENAEINAIRLRQQKNLLATLFFSQGTPMLLAGDEFGNSQQGNNNAYCQDNEIAWLNWQQIGADGEELLTFTKRLINFRRFHPLLNRPRFQHGRFRSHRTGLPDISWISPKGTDLTGSDWQRPDLQCFGMLLATTSANHDTAPQKLSCSIDDGLLVIFNAADREQAFVLPELNGHWHMLFNTAMPAGTCSTVTISNSQLVIDARCLTVLGYTHNYEPEKQ